MSGGQLESIAVFQSEVRWFEFFQYRASLPLCSPLSTVIFFCRVAIYSSINKTFKKINSFQNHYFSISVDWSNRRKINRHDSRLTCAWVFVDQSNDSFVTMTNTCTRGLLISLGLDSSEMSMRTAVLPLNTLTTEATDCGLLCYHDRFLTDF